MKRYFYSVEVEDTILWTLGGLNVFTINECIILENAPKVVMNFLDDMHVNYKVIEQPNDIQILSENIKWNGTELVCYNKEISEQIVELK